MQTIQFQCGHCGKLMAVSEEFLGKQVRCPHCQQVVVAPAPTPPVPPDPFSPGPSPAEVEERESIFSEHHDEDLFGDAPRPVAEMPPEPPAPPPSSQVVDFQPPAEPGAGFAVPDAGLSAIGPPGDGQPAPAEASPESAPAAESEIPWHESVMAAPAESSQPEPVAPVEQLVVKQVRGGGNLPMLLLIILVPYSIFMTAIAGYIYFKSPIGKGSSGAHPLEMLPDEGLNPGVRRVLHGKRFPVEGKEAELPPQLRVALGKTLRIGDLEVIPREVALRRIVVNTEGFNPQPENALVLSLHLKNVSIQVAFHPVDPFFDRAWKDGDRNGKPYTYLAVDGSTFYGGLIAWEDAIGKDRPRQYIPEQHGNRELKPGEEMDTIVCSALDERLEHALASSDGPSLWRVQLRRGLVEVRGRDASATAVIGVEFQKSDVVRKLDEGNR